MPGSVFYDPDPIPLARQAAAVQVWRYNSDATDDETRYELLPNVVCVAVSRRIGGSPWLARFRYVFVDPLLDPDHPRRTEEVYPLDAHGPGVVSADDRLVVGVVHDDGATDLLFDGFVQVPQADITPDGESVTFAAAATPVREWDTPLGGAIVRDHDNPLGTTDTRTDLPARFNPDGHPNASPLLGDSGADPNTYPVFLGPVWPANEINGLTVRAWTLAMAARYVIVQGLTDPVTGDLSTWVDPGDLTYLDTLLVAISPTADGATINYGDPSTYRTSPIVVQDVDVTGEPWPAALQRLVEPHGFGVRWILAQNSGGDPVWKLRVFRTDLVETGNTLSLYLQAAGGDLDPAKTNVQAVSLSRDTHDLANRIEVDTKPTAYEASFVLAPGFTVAAGDASTLDNYKRSSAGFGANRDKYRLYVFDECGEGHWDFGGAATVQTPGDLSPVLNPDKAKTRPFARRRRPGRDTLISVDGSDKPLRASLAVSFDYRGPEPGVWDGTGTWQTVSDGSWRLLEDRLGVYLTMETPNEWGPGKLFTIPSGLTGIPPGVGKINLVEWTAAAPVSRPRLMLTCVIEADRGLGVAANRRDSSPTVFPITRHVDARDRFGKTVISRWSVWGLGLVTGDDEDVRDDTEEAKAHAAGVQRSREAATFAGSVTVPRLTLSYDVGDKVDVIEGRGISLRSNAAAEAGESPTYPTVTAVTHLLDGRQETQLELSDSRAEPPPKRGARRADS